jgi:hypothetical protein
MLRNQIIISGHGRRVGRCQSGLGPAFPKQRPDTNSQQARN